MKSYVQIKCIKMCSIPESKELYSIHVTTTCMQFVWEIKRDLKSWNLLLLSGVVPKHKLNCFVDYPHWHAASKIQLSGDSYICRSSNALSEVSEESRRSSAFHTFCPQLDITISLIFYTWLLYWLIFVLSSITALNVFLLSFSLCWLCIFFMIACIILFII